MPSLAVTTDDYSTFNIPSKSTVVNEISTCSTSPAALLQVSLSFRRAIRVGMEGISRIIDKIERNVQSISFPLMGVGLSIHVTRRRLEKYKHNTTSGRKSCARARVSQVTMLKSVI